MKPREISPLRPVLKALLNPVAYASLCKHMAPAEVRHLLDHTWQLYPAHLQAVDNRRKMGIGPTLVLRLAASTIALHAALVDKGETHERAIQLVAEVGWAVYRRMGRIPWMLSGIISRDASKRLLISTKVFRRFPFGPSAYVWKSRPAPEGVVAFDCLRCPVAEHFAQVGLSDLCVRTFCALDFPLAQDWSAVLRRTSSIAAGAPVCDFRWHANSAQPLATTEPAPSL